MSSPLLYIHSSTIGTERANSVHAFAMAKAMTRLSDQVTLIAPDITSGSRRELEAHGVVCIAARKEAHGWIPKRLRLLWTSWKLICTSPSNSKAITRYLPLMILDAMTRNRQIVYDLHMPPFEQGRLIALAFRIFARMKPGEINRRIVTISEVLANIIQMAYGTEKPKVCHDASDDFRLPALVRREDQNSQVATTIGFAGSLTKGKGFNLVEDLARALPHLRFIVAGNVPDSGLTGIPSNMELRGFLTRDKIAAFYGECAVTLVPNQREMRTYGNSASIGLYNSPLKLFEGMSAETAIVVSDLSNLREVLDKDTALFCDPENLEAWVRALRLVSEDAGLRHGLAANARARFLELHTWQSRAKEMLGI